MTRTSSSSSARSEILSFRYSKDESCFEFPDATTSFIDYTSEIPDDCLAVVFQFVGAGGRKRCSLVSRRWLLVEGQSPHRLAINAKSEVKLSLRCDRNLLA
ncbi:hypothetical protein L1887_39782 [Cichorium endivia]|nr:hypothetical protein L1887_39782 [Cichorium endivia]